MAGDTEERFWRAEEPKILVQWIEEPDNQARLKKGSGLTKKAALAPLVDRLAARNSQQVFDNPELSDRFVRKIRIESSHSILSRFRDQTGVRKCMRW